MHPPRRRQAAPIRRPGRFRNGPIPVIGLVGGIGAGKSRVAELLAGRGAMVLDADAIGHALLDQRPAREEVVRRFGPGLLIDGDSPRIDRRALGAIVFEDRRALRDLEAILHPRMRRTFERAIDRATRKREAKGVVLDAAVLFEAGWNDLCDVVAFVDAPPELRLARLAAARGWTAEQLAARERAQFPLDAKRRRSDAVIPNDAGPDELAEAVGRLWDGVVRPRRAGRPDGPQRI